MRNNFMNEIKGKKLFPAQHKVSPGKHETILSRFFQGVCSIYSHLFLHSLCQYSAYYRDFIFSVLVICCPSSPCSVPWEADF